MIHRLLRIVALPMAVLGFGGACVVAVGAGSAFGAPPENRVPPNVRKAEEIIAKHIEAIGGAGKIKALTTLRVKGRVEQSGLELPFTLWRKRPDKSRVEVGFKGMFLLLAHDGRRTWWVNPLDGALKPEDVPPAYANLVLRWSDFEGPLVRYREKGHRVEYEGEQKAESGVAHRIKLTLANGEVWRVFIDAKTFLEVKRSYPQASEHGERETTVWFRGYSVVEGVKLYRVIEGKGVDGKPFTMTLTSYEANVPVENERFEKP